MPQNNIMWMRCQLPKRILCISCDFSSCCCSYNNSRKSNGTFKKSSLQTKRLDSNLKTKSPKFPRRSISKTWGARGPPVPLRKTGTPAATKLFLYWQKAELKQEKFYKQSELSHLSQLNLKNLAEDERENLVEKVTTRIQSLHWSIKIAWRRGSCGRSSLLSSQCWIMWRKSSGLAATRPCRAMNVARRPKSWSTSSWECPERRCRIRALPMRPEAKGLLSNTQINRIIFSAFL